MGKKDICRKTFIYRFPKVPLIEPAAFSACQFGFLSNVIENTERVDRHLFLGFRLVSRWITCQQ
jgi:hypothetical protein